MIKLIRNTTDKTLSITLFGHIYEIPTGWSLTAEEVWGGEETLRYVAVKFIDSIKIIDEEGNEPEKVECPGCGNKVTVKKVIKEEVIKEGEEEQTTKGRSKK